MRSVREKWESPSKLDFECKSKFKDILSAAADQEQTEDWAGAEMRRTQMQETSLFNPSFQTEKPLLNSHR